DRRWALGVSEAEASQPMPFKLLNAPPAPLATEAERAAAATSPALEPASSAATPHETTPKGKDAKSPPAVAAAAGMAASKAPTAERSPGVRMAAAAGAAAKPLVPPAAPAAGQKCRVWTASYGGQKALIIRSIVDKVVNYTVLDVNEGAEKREAEAFIAAYAKEGAVAGEFASQTQALDKAFELRPEG